MEDRLIEDLAVAIWPGVRKAWDASDCKAWTCRSDIAGDLVFLNRARLRTGGLTVPTT